MKKSLCFFIGLLLPTLSHAQVPENFNQAKKVAGQIFAQNPVTLYCGCQYSKNKIDLNSCGMEAAQGIPRAHVLEWEHMMPAENFGRQLTCWRDQVCVREEKRYRGRKCCVKSSADYRRIEAELYNLWPAVGLVNQARSNYRYSVFGQTSATAFYGCPILIDKKIRQVEPRNETKGVVARANLFMSQKYGIKLSETQRALFIAWDKKFPPSEWERNWARQVTAIEGYSNPFIESQLAQVGN